MIVVRGCREIARDTDDASSDEEDDNKKQNHDNNTVANNNNSNNNSNNGSTEVATTTTSATTTTTNRSHSRRRRRQVRSLVLQTRSLLMTRYTARTRACQRQQHRSTVRKRRVLFFATLSSLSLSLLFNVMVCFRLLSMRALTRSENRRMIAILQVKHS